MLGFSVQSIYAGLKAIETRIFLKETSFRKFYGHHADLVHQFDTSVSHMLNGLFTNYNIVSSYLGKS